jgi:hypothetical protein
LATVSEDSEPTLARRTALRSGPPAAGGNVWPGLSRNKLYYRSESINIMDESHRPAWKHGPLLFPSLASFPH